MDFFEKLGKRLSDAGQNVAQQTKNFADVTQLNSAISDKEKKISQLFQAIGQAYYENHKNDPTAEDQEKISQISTLYAEIEQNREKIKQLKGVTKCANCGADVPVNAAFCNNCGSKTVQPVAAPAVPENQRLCPVCQQVVGKDNAFCNHCGAKI